MGREGSRRDPKGERREGGEALMAGKVPIMATGITFSFSCSIS